MVLLVLALALVMGMAMVMVIVILVKVVRFLITVAQIIEELVGVFDTKVREEGRLILVGRHGGCG